MAGDVEVTGDLTAGTTVFDRRPRGDWRKNMEVVTEFDKHEVAEALVRGLRFAAQETRD
jgi:purine nucleosidase